MRVLRVGFGEGGTLDLHPAVSVVSGLSDPQRDALRRTFRAVGTGLEPEVPVLLEAHGLLLDAVQADLDLLDVPSGPAGSVATAAEVAGAVPAGDADRLHRAEGELLRLASDRAEACAELRKARAGPVPTTHHHLQARAESLQARIDRCARQDPEPVRVALDRIRDEHRAGLGPDTGAVVAALADVGIDLGDLGIPVAELVRIAEDWLDERRVEVAALVGVEIELRGIEAVLDQPHDGEGEPGAGDREALAARAAAAHADAITRVDQVHAELVREHRPRPSAAELEQHLVARLPGHRPARLAGSVPLLVDGAFTHLDGSEAGALLDRLAGLAGGVQLVVVDDHPAVGGWADAAGVRRAARVVPIAPSPAVAPA